MKYTVGEHSIRGGRKINQDRIAYAERDNAVLMVLADGLGGHARGELASELFVQTVIQQFTSIRQPLIEQPSAFLALSIIHAHKMIRAMGKAHQPRIEPRTTCVLCLVQNGYAYWAHVGDSRLYLFRNGQLIERTQDDTMIERMRQEGILTEEEMLTHPHKSRLLRCVGGPKEPSVSLGQETLLNTGDVLLLCTDGLWEALPMETISGYLHQGNLEDSVVDMLLAAEAAKDGNSDNISAIAFAWQDTMSTEMPLQPDTASEVNQAGLKQAAQDRMHEADPPAAGNGHAPTKPDDGRDSDLGNIEGMQEIEDDLKQLEAYLDKFNTKDKD